MLDALSSFNSYSRISPHSTSVDLPVFNIPGTRLSWVAVAAARLHISSADHLGVRMDGEHGSADGGYQFADSNRRRDNRSGWTRWQRVSSAAEVARSLITVDQVEDVARRR